MNPVGDSHNGSTIGRWVDSARHGSPLIKAVAAVAVVGIAFLAWQAFKAPAPSKGEAKIPVSVENVMRRDVPIFRTGLGTVRAFNSVILKVQVDGALQKIMFREGQEVKAGDVIAQIDPRPYQAALDLALARRAQNHAMLVKARGDLERYRTLNRSQFASQQNLEAQEAIVAQAEAAVKGDDAQIQSARVQLGYTTIVAPITGRIGLRQVDVGNIVRAADQVGIAVISQVHPVSVIFNLSASELSAITKAGIANPLRVIAYTSDDKEKLAEGELLTVDNAVDESSGSVKLKATFANEDNQLWPGQTVSAHVQLSIQNGALTIPARAAQRGPEGLYVYVVQPDSTVAVRAIETSESVDDSLVIVSTTLSEGDVIVTDGQSRLRPGARVAVRNGSKMNTPGAAPKDG
jgi:multidrug efflux system membrane fusion protein